MDTFAETRNKRRELEKLQRELAREERAVAKKRRAAQALEDRKEARWKILKAEEELELATKGLLALRRQVDDLRTDILKSHSWAPKKV